MGTYKNFCTPQIPTVQPDIAIGEIVVQNQADSQEKVSSLLCQGY